MFRLRVCARVRIYIFRLDIAFKTWQHYRSFSFYRNLFIYLIFIFVFTINLPISSKCHVEQLSSLRIIDISLKKKRKKREKKEKSFETRFKISQRESSKRTTRHPIPLLLFILNNYLADETWLSKRKKKKTNEISDNRKKSRIQNLYPDFRISVHIYIYIYIQGKRISRIKQELRNN